MNSLHSQQQWELMRERQAELIKEAQRQLLASQVAQPKHNWLSNLFSRPAQQPASARPPRAINASVSPELG